MGFHQQPEAEEMSVHPKATLLRAGLPNFHPALPGAAGPPLSPSSSHLSKTDPSPAKFLTPVLCWHSQAGRSPESPGRLS